jgi:3',5'-cyclic AMP phosphodiesterase CpdA
MVGYVKQAVLAAILFTGFQAPALTAEAGRFTAISDIHFDPFGDDAAVRALAAARPADWPALLAGLPSVPASQYGSDTNRTLLASALAAIAAAGADADFAIVSGDLLSHGFDDDAAKVLGVEAAPGLAERTSLFVAESVARTHPGKPVILALGNNDSGCGDYEIEPGGAYLAALGETVKRLAGEGRVAADFDTTWRAGGYYAVAHPTVPGTSILVLNDILWSTRYQDACGTDGLAAGRAQMEWLSASLAAQAAAGGRVWLVHHIPWGIDAYSTLHAKGGTCAERVVPFMKAEFAEAFATAIRRHAARIELSLSGHIHTDDYRLLFDAAGTPVAADKIVPAISPIYGQNPAFQVFTYDRESGAPADFATIALANLPDLGPADGRWQESYVFGRAYGLSGYATDTVAALWNGLGQGGRIRDVYAANYNAGHGALPEADLDGYACAIGFVDPGAYSACYCGE